MPSRIWCARTPYVVDHDVSEVIRRLTTGDPTVDFRRNLVIFDLCSDLRPRQVALSPAHVSSVEPFAD